jgi:hypothetical protein
MSMTPYTRDAVHHIRIALNNGTPADMVRQSLGWDASMFDNICRRHGIDARAPVETMSAPPRMQVSPIPKSTLPPSHKSQGRTQVTIALNCDVFKKLERYAERAGIVRARAGGALVDDYLALNHPSRIEMLPRSARGHGQKYQYISISLAPDAAMVLMAEAELRCNVHLGLGALAKAIIVSMLDPSS